MAKRLIFGCGYVGERAAALWQEAGDDVFAVTRSEARTTAFREQGWRPIIADVTDPASLNELPEADTVLFAVGYDRSVDASIAEVYAGGVAAVIEALPAGTGRFVYVSSTGVYGDAGGDWVDESTTPNPGRAGGKASLAAERVVAKSRFAANSATLRLAGIYGPDRLPYLKAIKAGEPIAASQTGWLNLIHRDDAAAVVVASAAAEAPPGLLCVSDGSPPQRSDYYAEVARLLRAPAPRFVDPEPGSPRAARAAADKRVSNQRLVDGLGHRLRYPDYRSGLAAILGDG
ncbi:MAG: NAD-dependent epimerase/dehydratase family protein [Planctomycetota bacterium]